MLREGDDSASGRTLNDPAERRARLHRLAGLGLSLSLGGGGAIALGAAGLVLRGSDVGSAPIDIDPANILFAVLIGLGSIACIAGLLLFVVSPSLDADLARRSAFAPQTLAGGLALAVVLGALLATPVYLFTTRDDDVLRRSIALLAGQTALLTVLVIRVIRPGVLTWDDLGLNAVALDRRIWQGVIGGLAILALSVSATQALQEVGVAPTQYTEFMPVAQAGPTQFAGFFLLAVVVAPACEELFFRGWMFTALRHRYARWVAYCGSGAVFAAIHLNVQALAPIAAMALILAFLYDRTRSVIPSMVAHGLNNAVMLASLYWLSGGSSGRG